jgi:hypothetical protein
LAKLTIGFGAALILLGVVCWALTEPTPEKGKSWTALIPAIEGVLLLACGAVALSPKLLKHAMHLAAVIGVLGFIGALQTIIKRKPSGLALVDMAGMALLSAIFVGLCVWSFIQARRARRAQGFPVQ